MYTEDKIVAKHITYVFVSQVETSKDCESAVPASASAPVSTFIHAPAAVPASATASAPSFVDEDPHSEPVDEEETTDHAHPMLSPRAFRNRPMTSTSSAHQQTSSSTGINTTTVNVRPTPVEPSKRATTRDFGVQCCSVTAVPMAGVEMQCRMCGVLYDMDSRSRRKRLPLNF